MDTESHSLRGHSTKSVLVYLMLLKALSQCLCMSSCSTESAALGGSPTTSEHSTLETWQLAWGSSGSVCGKPRVMGKILGGQDAMEGQWPWQASLQYRGVHLCGAVLIDSDWVVSAAHCFNKKSHAPEDYWVFLGSTQLYQDTLHTKKVAVSRIILHPDFEKLYHFTNDIAMLKLHQPVNFTSYIVPVCLPNPSMDLPLGSPCWITGWGKLSEDRQLPPPYTLQEGKVHIIGNKLCNNIYEDFLEQNHDYSVEQEMLCVRNISREKGICNGDSGGPLVCDFSKTWFLLGLASWGMDCQHPIYPSIFTNVTHFSKWIFQIKRSTSLLNPFSAPPVVPFPDKPQQVASSSVTIQKPLHLWLLLLLVLKVLQ